MGFMGLRFRGLGFRGLGFRCLGGIRPEVGGGSGKSGAFGVLAYFMALGFWVWHVAEDARSVDDTSTFCRS